jgi:Cu/Zn superoxide dismutase
MHAGEMPAMITDQNGKEMASLSEPPTLQVTRVSFSRRPP